MFSVEWGESSGGTVYFMNLFAHERVVRLEMDVFSPDENKNPILRRKFLRVEFKKG